MAAARKFSLAFSFMYQSVTLAGAIFYGGGSYTSLHNICMK